MPSVIQLTIPSVLCFVVPSFAIALLSKVILTNNYRRSFPALSWFAVLSLAVLALLAGVVGFSGLSKAEQVILTCLYTELGASVIYLSFKYTCTTLWLIPYTLSLSLSLFCVSITCFAAPYIAPLTPLVPPLISLLFTLFTLPLIIYPLFLFLSSSSSKFSRFLNSKSRRRRRHHPRGSKQTIAFPISTFSSTASLPQPPPHIYTSSLSLASLSTLPPKSPMGSGFETKEDPGTSTPTTPTSPGFQHQQESIPLRRYPCRSDSRRFLTGRRYDNVIYHQEKRARKVLFTLLSAQLFSLVSGILLLAIAAIAVRKSSKSGVINATATDSNTAVLRVIGRAFMVLDVCGVMFAFFLHGIPLERGDELLAATTTTTTDDGGNPPVTTRNQDQQEEEAEASAGPAGDDINITKPEEDEDEEETARHVHYHPQVQFQQQQPSPTSVTVNSNNAVHFPNSGGEPITTSTTNRVGRSCTLKLPPSGLRIFTNSYNNNTGCVAVAGVVAEDKQQSESPRQYAHHHHRFDSTSSSFSSPRLKRPPIITTTYFDDNKDLQIHSEPTPIDSDDHDDDHDDHYYDDGDDEGFEFPILTKDGRYTTMTTHTQQQKQKQKQQLPSPPDTPIIVENSTSSGTSSGSYLHRESWPQQIGGDSTKKVSIWFGKYNSEETLLEKKKQQQQQQQQQQQKIQRPRRQTVLPTPSSSSTLSSSLPFLPTTTNTRPSLNLPPLPHPTTANSTPPLTPTSMAGTTTTTTSAAAATSPHKRSMSSLPLSKADWYPFISKAKIVRSYSTIIGSGGREPHAERNGGGGGGDNSRGGVGASNNDGGGGGGGDHAPDRADFVDLTDPFASPPPPDIIAKQSRENLSEFGAPIKGKMRVTAAAAAAAPVEDNKRKELKKIPLPPLSPPPNPPSPPSPPSCYRRDSRSSSSFGSIVIPTTTRVSNRTDSPVPFLPPSSSSSSSSSSGSIYSTRGRGTQGRNGSPAPSSTSTSTTMTTTTRNSRRTSSQSTTTTIRRKGSPLPIAFRRSSSLTQPPSPSSPTFPPPSSSSYFPSSSANANLNQQRRSVSEGTTTTTTPQQQSRTWQKSSLLERDEAPVAAVTIETLNVDEIVLAQRLLTRLDSVCRDGYF